MIRRQGRGDGTRGARTDVVVGDVKDAQRAQPWQRRRERKAPAISQSNIDELRDTQRAAVGQSAQQLDLPSGRRSRGGGVVRQLESPQTPACERAKHARQPIGLSAERAWLVRRGVSAQCAHGHRGGGELGRWAWAVWRRV